jgi:DNA-binding NarL/FixJ family response regulator
MRDRGLATDREQRDVRVAIADGRPLIAEALAAVLDAQEGFTVITVFDGREGLPALAADQPDVILLGAGSDARAVVRLATSLRHLFPEVGIVIVADELAHELVHWVLDVPLTGLLLTDARAAQVARCVDQVLQGQTVLPSGWRGTPGVAPGEDLVGALSERQLEVLRLLADGHSYGEIAGQLYISVNTVKFHVRAIFLRLGVRNRMAAARLLAESSGAQRTGVPVRDRWTAVR